jgi:DNA-directed RNA polymerase specialized sigma24 family protein
MYPAKPLPFQQLRTKLIARFLDEWCVLVGLHMSQAVQRLNQGLPSDASAAANLAPARNSSDPDTVLSDSVGLALLVVLDTLTPAERVAFVLHDMFAVAFQEIAPILDRSPDAARQLTSRAPAARPRSGDAASSRPRPSA